MKNIIKKFAVTLFALPLVFGSLGSLGQVTAKADRWVGGISQSKYNDYCRLLGVIKEVRASQFAGWGLSGKNVSCYASWSNSYWWKDADALCRFIHGGSSYWYADNYTYFSGWNCYRRI